MSKKILILSPHPDDDVIGMGGTIASKIQQGEHIDIVYITDGVGSFRTVLYKDFSDADFSNLREKEAIESINIISSGSNNIKTFFLKLKSSQLKTNPEIFKEQLRKILKNNYDEIYLPHLNDRHPTHVAVSKITSELILKEKINSVVLGYEIWNPILFTEKIINVDITASINLKKLAIQAHKSQCSIKAFDKGIIAKNKYNAIYADINCSNNVHFLEIFVSF